VSRTDSTASTAAADREPATRPSRERDRRLKPRERRRLAVLGLPTLGFALAITTVSSYLPVVASGFIGSSALIGLLIGGEGFMALFVPLIVGVWSDRLKTRLGGRLPFVLAATPVMALTLVSMGLVRSLGPIAAALAVFFVAYYVGYEPYRALYPDLFAESVAGRSQANQAVWRGLGTIGALVSGGLLLSAATFLPFVSSALVLGVAVGLFAALIAATSDLTAQDRPGQVGVRDAAGRLLGLLRKHPALRTYLAANALWELSLGGLKTFIVLYVTRGLGYSLSAASLIIGVVALVVLGGALGSGKLADRIGRLRTMHLGLWIYGVTLAIPIFTAEPAVIGAAAPVIALGGGMIMSLPYAILMPLMPESEHGSLTGFYSLSRGVGTMLGPLLAGLCVQALGGPFEATEGYAAMWIVCSGAILGSIPVLRRLWGQSGDRARLRGE
jgi:MFS family permease